MASVSLNYLCSLGKGCFGCCLKNPKCKADVMNEIKKNTAELKKSKSLKKFMKRHKGYVMSSGACQNLVLLKNGKYGCAIYGRLKNELPSSFCYSDYLCKTAKAFNKWAPSKRKAFLKFIKNKKLSAYDFSVCMDNNALLKDFNKKK